MFIGYIGTDSIGSLIKRFAAKKAGVEDGRTGQSVTAASDMLAWSEGTDNGRQKTRNHGYDVIVGGELFTDYPITSQTVTLNQNSNQQAPDATVWLLSRWWDAYRKQLGLKDFSPKSQTLWHCSRLRSVALYL